MEASGTYAADAEYFEQAGSFFRTLGALVYTELTQADIDNLAKMDFLGMAQDMEPGDLELTDTVTLVYGIE